MLIDTNFSLCADYAVIYVPDQFSMRLGINSPNEFRYQQHIQGSGSVMVL